MSERSELFFPRRKTPHTPRTRPHNRKARSPSQTKAPKSAPKHRTGNDLLHNLRSAAINPLHPRIDEIAGNRILGGVAVTTEQLQTAIGNTTLHLSGAVLGHGCCRRIQLAIFVFADALVDERFVNAVRSEERRVGKECRSGWSRYDYE